jgi:hypothetical protein
MHAFKKDHRARVRCASRSRRRPSARTSGRRSGFVVASMSDIQPPLQVAHTALTCWLNGGSMNCRLTVSTPSLSCSTRNSYRSRIASSFRSQFGHRCSFVSGVRPQRCTRLGRRGSRRCHVPGSNGQAKSPVLHDRLAVGGDSPTGAQIADKIPVQGADVLPAGFGVAATQRQMYRPFDLLVWADNAVARVAVLMRATGLPRARFRRPPRRDLGGGTASLVRMFPGERSVRHGPCVAAAR